MDEPDCHGGSRYDFATGCLNNSANRTSTAVESTTAEATVAETTLAGGKNSSVAAENSDLYADDGTIVVTEQGMFSAGGITVTSEGTFDLENHW